MLMRYLPLLFLGVAGCSTAAASITPSPPVVISKQAVIKSKKTMNLNSYQWKNRLLLVFAPSENNADYQQQIQLLQGQQASLDERNLIVIDVLNANYEDLAKLRKQFNVNPQEFRVILVGKDGTAKRRDSSPVSPKTIFETIDAMPMRQQEMRQNN